MIFEAKIFQNVPVSVVKAKKIDQEPISVGFLVVLGAMLRPKMEPGRLQTQCQKSHGFEVPQKVSFGGPPGAHGNGEAIGVDTQTLGS